MTSQDPDRPRWRRFAILIVLALAALLLADLGLSSLLNRGPLRGFLASRLEAKFGRTVEVSNFSISLLGGPRLEANYFTVAEDPRFGQEYFLRAERLTASLRWRSLLRGRFEFGTLAFTRPSLNLVRIPTGQWNLESWLPAPSSAPAAVAPEGTAPEGRIYRIEIDTGRINFKRGVDKHPFALVDVNGFVEQEAPGRWRLDLETSLLRAGVVVQEAGLLRLRGRIGGTAARLRPADLRIEWEDASLADVLRLVRGQDYGVRGRVSLEAVAQSGLTETAKPAAGFAPWSFRVTARLRGIHRWDLPPRSGDPSLNLLLEAGWKPEEASVELTRAELEAPGSSVSAAGFLTWAQPPGERSEGKDFRLRFTAGGIALSDVLAWYRGFRPGVNDPAVLEGNAGVDLQLSGWPLRIERGVLAVDGAQLRVPGLAAPVKLGSRFLIKSERESIVLLATPLTFSPAEESRRAADSLRVEGKLTPFPAPRFELNLSGEASQLPQVLAAVSALGWTPFPGWGLEGSANLKLRWQGSFLPFAAQLLGTVDLRNVSLRVPFLSQPAQLVNARLELAPNGRRFTITSAQAFGARWSGVVGHKDGSAPWDFALTADRIETAEMAPWFATQEAGGLLARIAPSAGPGAAIGAVPMLRASGRVDVGQLSLRPLELRHVRAQVELEGDSPWRIRVTGAQADFYGGSVNGTLEVTGGRQPSYRFAGQFERVNLATLVSPTQTLAERFAGTASGELRLSASGVNRDALLDSLDGRGRLDVRSGEIRGLDLFGWVRSAVPDSRARAAQFQSANGTFAVASRAVQIENLRLAAGAAELEISGTVDFLQTLDLRVRELPRAVASKSPAVPPPDSTGRAIRITGTLSAPQVAAQEEPAAAPAGAKRR